MTITTRAVLTAAREQLAAGLKPAGVDAAMAESRHRWREMVGLLADLSFETDESGRFTLVFPDPALGWSAGTLLGQPAHLLLADATTAPRAVAGFNPFRCGPPVRRRRAWLTRADGSVVCLAFATTPIMDSDGALIGMRGVAQDVTEQDSRDAAVAATLRRGEVLDAILSRMRQEVLAPRMMQAALTTLVSATGADGGAVMDLTPRTAQQAEAPLDVSVGDPRGRPIDLTGMRGLTEPEPAHAIGRPTATVMTAARLLAEGIMDAAGLADAGPLAQHCWAPDGRAVLVSPGRTRGGGRMALVLWRDPGARLWDEEEQEIAAAASGIIRMVLEHDAIQREMGRQARTDPLTGLLNRRAFLDDLVGRIARLDREQQPGTLMFVDLDHFKALNDRRGHETGDEALCVVAAILRATVRPFDLVARFGGDEFALWLDGADELTAAERAENLRVDGARQLAYLTRGEPPFLAMSIGIACRWPTHNTDIDTLLRRADAAMYEVKRSGRGHWRVARTERT